MPYPIVFEIERQDDTAQAQASPENHGLFKAMIDFALTWPLDHPDTYVLSKMRDDMLEWLNTSTALRGNNRMGLDQTRTGELSFTRNLYVEFDDAKDAMLFRLTWGTASNEA